MPMRAASLSLLIAAILPITATAQTSDADVMAHVQRDDFAAAMAILSGRDAATRATYEHRYLEARILSWSGDYAAADRALAGLRADYPGNPDIELASGNLEYYQGNLDAADMWYGRVAAAYPDYADARTGIANVARARTAGKGTTWRIDAGVGVSGFERDDFQGGEIANWNTQFVRVEYAPDSLAFSGSVRRLDRFGLDDIELRAGIADAVRGGWDWGMEAGITPDADFRPDFALGARVGRAVEMSGGTVLYPNASVAFDSYAVGDIVTAQPGLTAYLDNGLVLNGRLIASFPEAQDDQLGWLVDASKTLGERFRVRGGLAMAPESIDGIVVDTDSLFGGVTWVVSDTLDVHLDLARDDRENSYVRNSVNVGVTLKR